MLYIMQYVFKCSNILLQSLKETCFHAEDVNDFSNICLLECPPFFHPLNA